MAVQVTLTFNSYDEAIVALGKLVGAKVAAPVVKAETAAPAEDKPAARTRKPRADAGQPRGPYKARNEPAAPQQGEPTSAAAPVVPTDPAPAAEAAAPQTEAPAEPPAPATQAANPPAASAPSEKDAQAALEKLFNEKAKAGGNGAAIQAAKDLLARYGVQKVRDLPAERRVEFIKECEAGGAA